MSIEEIIRTEMRNANNPVLQRFDRMEKEILELKSIIAKKEDKPLRIKEAAALLKCHPDTFHRHKHHIKACGGTQRNPLYYREDVLSLREKIRNNDYI